MWCCWFWRDVGSGYLDRRRADRPLPAQADPGKHDPVRRGGVDAGYGRWRSCRGLRGGRGVGLAFGGAATLFQTALARSAGDAADIAQSMLVTAWNAAIASGGIVGGVLLDRFGVGAFSPALLVLLLATLLVAWSARDRGFPASVG